MHTGNQLIEPYLLGDLSDEDRAAVEDRLFADDDFFEAVQLHEDELIDGYVHSNLSTRQKTLFETNFLASPRRQERLKTALALDAYIVRQVPSQTRPNWFARFRSISEGASPFPRVAFAACTLAIIAAIAVVSIKLHQQRESASVVRQMPPSPQGIGDPGEKTKLPEFATEAQTPAATNARTKSSVNIASLMLPPGLVRGDEDHILDVRKEVRQVRLLLEATYELPAGNYAVGIHNASNVEVWAKELRLSRAQRPPLVVAIPAEALPAGSYTLSLTKTGSDAPLQYAFIVRRTGK